ncbi:hypothetical protein GDO86_019596, partial [Hymenochirus boettgeri]
ITDSVGPTETSIVPRQRPKANTASASTNVLAIQSSATFEQCVQTPHNQNVIAAERYGNGHETLLAQGSSQQTPQQHRVLQQLQPGDWRLQQIHQLQQQHLQRQQQLLQEAYMQQ